MIDLHSHTNASDGEHPPEALIRRAYQAGVRFLAVTDHDTVAALGEAAKVATEVGLTLVPGIEISTHLNGREIHVLGHFVRPDDPALLARLAGTRDDRRARMEAMVARMSELGFPMQMADVEAVAGNAQLCRPHLALAIVRRGYATSVVEAFDRFLGDGRPAVIPRDKLSAAEAVALIRGAGGTASIAHPGVSRLNRLELEQLRAVGLDGLEVIHSDHNPSVREKFFEIARDLDLVPTAGSDFHGVNVAPNRELGSVDMGAERFAALKARSTSGLLLGAPAP